MSRGDRIGVSLANQQIQFSREAVVIFLVWVAAVLCPVPYCYATGYNVVGPNSVEQVDGVLDAADGKSPDRSLWDKAPLIFQQHGMVEA